MHAHRFSLSFSLPTIAINKGEGGRKHRRRIRIVRLAGASARLFDFIIIVQSLRKETEKGSFCIVLCVVHCGYVHIQGVEGGRGG